MMKRLKENTILITGGAGFLGINLIRYLLNREFTDIRSLDMATFDYPERDRIQTILGDIRDRETVRKAVQDVDWVVHAAAALPLYPKEDIYSTAFRS
jgi:nucleoside-diphosphate-sugar epimerase